MVQFSNPVPAEVARIGVVAAAADRSSSSCLRTAGRCLPGLSTAEPAQGFPEAWGGLPASRRQQTAGLLGCRHSDDTEKRAGGPTRLIAATSRSQGLLCRRGREKAAPPAPFTPPRAPALLPWARAGAGAAPDRSSRRAPRPPPGRGRAGAAAAAGAGLLGWTPPVIRCPRPSALAREIRGGSRVPQVGATSEWFRVSVWLKSAGRRHLCAGRAAMPKSCAAPRCSNRYSSRCRQLTFHRFPRSRPELLARWVVNLGRTDFQPSCHAVLCSQHFQPDCFSPCGNRANLRPDAVPTLFTAPPAAAVSLPPCRAGLGRTPRFRAWGRGAGPGKPSRCQARAPANREREEFSEGC
ncbi:THAP domain-containing protein 3 isoform X2 [Alligator mississippiensis]|uniref:THAP domain-containing protein 3 isoform X2 n=1 Tax=Alligator mississippiensis TaxID=8496 RepID=UPI0009071D56|nr:THAP domain-containing protein 3 isoform X2 [Alligator mississippiensis]